MKRIFTIVSLLISIFSSEAAEYVIRDEVRGGVNQVILTSDTDPNTRLVIFVKEQIVELQFSFPERVPGIHIRDPKAFQWPVVFTNVFSVKFEPNLNKIISDDSLASSSMELWPACQKNSCPEGTPRVLENVRGSILTVRQPDGKIRYALGLTGTKKDFNGFYTLSQGSKRIVIEYNNSKQLIFNISPQ